VDPAHLGTTGMKKFYLGSACGDDPPYALWPLDHDNMTGVREDIVEPKGAKIAGALEAIRINVK
jgi:hypothetical protein